MIGSNNNTVKRVCNIRSIMVLRFMFGYYFDLHKPLVMRILSKLYCLAIACLLSYVYCINSLPRNNIVVVTSIIEHMLFTVTSLFNKEEYILDFFRYRPITDGLPCAKNTFKLMERLLKLFYVCWIAVKIITWFLLCISMKVVCYVRNPFPVLFNLIYSLSLDTASLSFILIFSLLYCRVNIIKNTFIKKGFQNSPRNRFTPRKYMQMYEAVLETLRDTDNPLKLLVFSYMITYIPTMIDGMYHCLINFKEMGPTYFNVTWLLSTIQPSFALIIAAVLLDMTAGDLVDIKCFTLSKCAESRNERERSEFQKLFMLLEEYPLRYNVYRIFPLSVKPLISCFSFSFTTIIAIIQIENF